VRKQELVALHCAAARCHCHTSVAPAVRDTARPHRHSCTRQRTGRHSNSNSSMPCQHGQDRSHQCRHSSRRYLHNCSNNNCNNFSNYNSSSSNSSHRSPRQCLCSITPPWPCTRPHRSHRPMAPRAPQYLEPQQLRPLQLLLQRRPRRGPASVRHTHRRSPARVAHTQAHSGHSCTSPHRSRIRHFHSCRPVQRTSPHHQGWLQARAT
jgi:hypothetical protein